MMTKVARLFEQDKEKAVLEATEKVTKNVTEKVTKKVTEKVTAECARETAKKMKAKNMPPELIREFTGLDQDTIAIL